MIKHIVIWKLKEQAEGRSKKENAWKIRLELEKLADLIPNIRSLEMGICIEESDEECDVVLSIEFDTVEDLRAYLSHPAHLAAGEIIGKLRAARYAIDYEA